MPEKFEYDKQKNFSEWYTEVLKQAELIDQRYPVKGFIVHRPMATICENLMYEIYERELQKTGHKPAMFPAVIPESFFEKEKEHVEGFAPGVFWVTRGGDEREFEEKLALRPTSETAMYSMYAQWIRSYKDLPLKIYQRCQVWRYETKATRPLLRGREFYWIESHDCFATAEEAERQVLEDIETTEKVIRREFGVPFYFFKRPEWDKFAGSVYSFACDVLTPDGKVVQQPSTHYYAQKFSEPFGIKFEDKDGKETYVYQTTYGPAISRILASVISTHGDNRGLRLPWSIAPYQVVIVPITKKESTIEVLKYATKIFSHLRKREIRVELDESDKRPGEKFYHWELRGACVRFEIGGKEAEERTITAARRDNGKKEKISEEQLDTYLNNIGDKILESLRKEADEHFKGNIHSASTTAEIKKALDVGGFVRIPFCSRDADGTACAEQLKADTEGGQVRGTLHGKDETPAVGDKCPVCGKQAKVIVYVAKSY
ncbi:MAG: proline--tRNA ligase [Candidatus Micrarchaeota archaeon]